MDYRRIGLAGGQLVQKGLGSIRQGYGGPQDWGQEAAAKQQGAANVDPSNPYSNVAQQQNRALNERVSREGRSNISKRNYQQGVKDFYNKHQGGGGLKNFLGNIFGGIGDKFGAWAGNMRGGINPQTGTWYTQNEYEENVQNRRNQARIARLRKTRDTGKYANDPKGWAASDLSGRLEGFEKGQWDRMSAMGMPTDTGYPGESQGIEGVTGVSDDFANARRAMTQVGLDKFRNNPVTGEPNFNRGVYDPYGIQTPTGAFSYDMNYQPDRSRVISEAEYNAQPEFNFNEGPEVLPTGYQFTGDLKDYQRGMVQDVGMNQDQLDAINKLHKRNLAVDQGTSDFFYWHPQQKDVAGFVEDIKEQDKTKLFSDTPKDIVYGDPTTGATTQEIQDYINSLSNIHGPIKNQTQRGYAGKNLIGIAQGGRVGYNTGGRVGILAAF